MNVDELIVKNVGLIKLTLKGMNLYHQREEYFDICMIGLMKGIYSFDPEKGYKISTYLTRCIKNEILQEIRRNECNSRKVNNNTISLNRVIRFNDDGTTICLEDMLASDIDLENDLLQNERLKFLKNQIDSLKEREKFVIKHSFGVFGCEKMKQKEIAKILNISQSHVVKIKMRVLNKLKIRLLEC